MHTVMKKKRSHYVTRCYRESTPIFYELDLLFARAASDTNVQNEDVLKCVSNLEDEAASSRKQEYNS